MHTITRRNLLLGGGALAGAGLLAGSRAAANGGGSPKKLLLVVASGGWDPVFALDPKPGASAIDVPSGTLEEYNGIPIWSDPTRPSVNAFFTAHAGLVTLVNGLQVQSLVHSDCSKRVLTGTSSDINPDFGAIVAYELGRDLP